MEYILLWTYFKLCFTTSTYIMHRSQVMLVHSELYLKEHENETPKQLTKEWNRHTKFHKTENSLMVSSSVSFRFNIDI